MVGSAKIGGMDAVATDWGREATMEAGMTLARQGLGPDLPR